MLEAFGWGFLAQSSLLVAGLVVCWITVPTKLVGILGGFGAGAMIAAVSFDLLPEAQEHRAAWQTGSGCWSASPSSCSPTASSSDASAPRAQEARWGSCRLGRRRS